MIHEPTRWTSATVLLLASFAPAFGADPVPRKNYGARFEPADKIIHGAGQTYSSEPQNHGFERYAETTGPDRFPLVFMDYNSANSTQSFYDGLKARLEAIQRDYGKYVVPQIGYYLPSGSTQITETQLTRLSNGLKSLDRPVFLRIGYEVNGTWYDPKYLPSPFISNFRAVVERLRSDEVPAAALWNMYPGFDSGGGSGGYYGNWQYMSQFYPGDEWVDWFSMDLFSVTDITNPHTAEFLRRADLHGKPVMLGEATPRYVGADDDSDWNTWFKPFFDMINENPGIKGHTYINWNWAGTRWPTWGDARLEASSTSAHVRQQYLAEISRDMYVHAGESAPGWIPEPTAASLMTIGGVFLALRRRENRR